MQRVLGCNIHTSNIGARGEGGARPLLIDIIKRIISYIKNINERRESIGYSAYEFELKNDSESNVKKYINNFNLSDGNEILEKKTNIIKEICQDNYDMCWCTMLAESPKANSYIKFKNRISLERYLSSIQNVRHRIALTRFRSTHNLLIEKGRHFRPKLEGHDRKCFICRDNVEDENHFIANCPLYSNQRFPLNGLFKNNSFFQLFNDEQKFIFIMTNENEDVMVELAKFIFSATKIREEAINEA